MKKSLQMMLISFGLLACTLTGYAQPTNYAPIPYSTGFETGTLDMFWFTQSTLATGRVQPWNSTTFSYGTSSTGYTFLAAHTGTYWLGLDTDGSGSYPNCTNQAWLGLDLSAVTGSLQLSFWYSEVAEEPHSDDGIFISDNGGVTFFKIADPSTANYTQWRYYNINLDSAIAYHGLTKSATFVVKFQEYDNWPFPVNSTIADGMMYDDIDVSTPLSNPDHVKRTSNVHVFPNPTQDKMTVDLGQVTSSIRYQLTTITGKQITSGVVNAPQFELDLHKYERGVYLLLLFSENGTETIKVIRQ
ncbi:MAG: T9SS type A sorting domain-containing protein [Flavobacteriales bacterium]|nr:T9SS type A sorting domain-containing protein [Flavobacteriales bacterium]